MDASTISMAVSSEVEIRNGAGAVVGVGVTVGAGSTVGRGVAAGVDVALGADDGLGEGDGVAVGIGDGVAVGVVECVGVRAGVGVTVGVGVGDDGGSGGIGGSGEMGSMRTDEMFEWFPVPTVAERSAADGSGSAPPSTQASSTTVRRHTLETRPIRTEWPAYHLLYGGNEG